MGCQTLSIFGKKSENIIINASNKVGLINEYTNLSLFLAFEPEVAEIDYNYPNISFVQQNNNGENPIICDIGGEKQIFTYIGKKN